MRFHLPRVPSSSSDEIIDAEHSNVCSTLLAAHPASSADSSSQNASASASDAILGMATMEYDNVLPQPPPSVPSGSAAQQQELNAPGNSTDTSTTTCTSLRVPPFRTARNIFGLVRQFFSSTPPSHDPEDVVMLRDISSIPTIAAAELDIPTEPQDFSFYPYPNQSSFELGHWYWNGSVQKSHQSFKQLIDIVGRPGFDPDDVRSTPWNNINLQLGASVHDEERDEWEDEDAGWQRTQVTIDVPFSQTTTQPGARPYIAADLYH
ncbi:hypothetical protein EV702DRAFT_1198130 [Suillus placidus]|uniref:Uncharacterized protein n=1 Tax=Suillus placidus TaxID=48579 RepID=A0A9P6ZTF9_9AGAM|nr:hypothetical protein EV702DRAFT_1198130 [Suillus placidus]